MDASQETGFPRVAREALCGEAARCAAVVVSWSAAGGITAGGLLVGFAALGSPEMAQALLPLTPALFLVGAAGGLVHGSVLAYVGRPPHTSRVEALRAIGTGVVLALPALVVAWVATAWISLTSAVLTLRTGATVALVVTGWAVGTAVCCWAALEGWRSFRCAFSRWPESRPGALLLVGVAVAFAMLFVGYHPEIWGTDVRVSGIGAVILALAATLWIALPIIVVLLHYLHRRFASMWDGPTATDRIVQSDL